jgi:hypothetical protein
LLPSAQFRQILQPGRTLPFSFSEDISYVLENLPRSCLLRLSTRGENAGGYSPGRSDTTITCYGYTGQDLQGDELRRRRRRGSTSCATQNRTAGADHRVIDPGDDPVYRHWLASFKTI